MHIFSPTRQPGRFNGLLSTVCRIHPRKKMRYFVACNLTVIIIIQKWNFWRLVIENEWFPHLFLVTWIEQVGNNIPFGSLNVFIFEHLPLTTILNFGFLTTGTLQTKKLRRNCTNKRVFSKVCENSKHAALYNIQKIQSTMVRLFLFC